jgi:lipoprotein-releasing system permease protein
MSKSGWLDRYEWQLAWRYLRGGRSGQRDGFVAFISLVSMLGIVLGVAALVVSTAVVNGFERDVRDRMLAVIPHLEVYSADGQALPDWQGTVNAARAALGSQVQAVSPFVALGAMLARGDQLRGVVLRGVPPDAQGALALGGQARTALQAGQRRMVLGATLAQELGLKIGDAVAVIVPGQAGNSNIDASPAVTEFQVAGLIQSGHHQYDSAFALIHLDDAAQLAGLSGPAAVQIQLAQQLDAPQAAARLSQALPATVIVRDWTRTNEQWFASVQIQKRMIFLILSLIAAVAAFNLVSTLVMTVTDKRADIAILRTLGASPGALMRVFILQGALVGVIGTAVGVALGLLVAWKVDALVNAVEIMFGVSLLPASVYFIDYMPSHPLASDVIAITAISLALALLATLYPSWRASRVDPAQALRYE